MTDFMPSVIIRKQQKCLWILLLLLFSIPLWAQGTFEGLVDIQEVDPSIQVELMYATKDNFVGENMYGDLTKAYMLPHFAEKLKRAQRKLKSDWGAAYSLLVCDAARPLSVQRRMYEAVKGTPNRVYVASSDNGGGRHNYGAAVDVTIVNTTTGERVDMGSEVDHFGIRSHTDNEQELLRKGLITRNAYDNRRYLTRLLNAEGLRNIRKEWWHFEERISIKEVRTKYRLIK